MVRHVGARPAFSCVKRCRLTPQQPPNTLQDDAQASEEVYDGLMDFKIACGSGDQSSIDMAIGAVLKMNSDYGGGMFTGNLLESLNDACDCIRDSQ